MELLSQLSSDLKPVDDKAFDRLMAWSEEVLQRQRSSWNWTFIFHVLLVSVILFVIFLLVHLTREEWDFTVNIARIANMVASILSILILLK